MKFFLPVVACFIALTSYAGPHRVGNGGNGVINTTANRIDLLDLVEANLQDAVFFNSATHNIYAAEIKSYLDDKIFPTELISRKLSEIAALDRITAESLILTLKLLDWQFVDYELQKTDDINTSLNIDPQLIVQLANRRYAQVLVNRNLWAQLNKAHQAALVIHELIYCLSHKKGETDSATNIKTRGIMSYIFSEKLKSMTQNSFDSLMSDSLPNINHIKKIYPNFKRNNQNLVVKKSESFSSLAFNPEIYEGQGKLANPSFYSYISNTEELDLKSHLARLCTYQFKTMWLSNSYYKVDVAFDQSVIGYVEWKISFEKSAEAMHHKRDLCYDDYGYVVFAKQTQEFFAPFWAASALIDKNY